MRFAAAVGRGGVKTPPYDAKDKRAVMAKSRAGHARPLQTSVSGIGGSGEHPNFKTAQRARALRTGNRSIQRNEVQ